MNTETLLPVLAELLAKSCVVLIFAALLIRAWRGANSAQHHFIWLAALGTIMLLPATKLVAPHWAIPLEPAQKISVVVPATSLPPMVLEDASSLLVMPSVPSTPVAVRTPIPWRSILLGLWLGGIALILGYRLFGSWRLHRLLRRSAAADDPRVRLLLHRTLSELGLRRRPEVRLSADCRVPITWGWLRPVLLLPREALGWSDTWLTAALRHEAAHILRGDSFTRWAAWIACAVYWPNPFIWLAAHSLRIAQEQAADDLVLRHGTPPEEYAAQLVAVARTVARDGLFLGHAVAMASPSTLEGRILAIVDGQRDRRPLSRLAASLGALTVLATLAVCTAAQLQGADQTSEEKGKAAEAPAATTAAPEIEISTKFVEIVSQADGSDGQSFAPVDQQIYTDPQFQVIVRALNQKKGVDLLSAPRVITRSGKEATIEIVRDFRYPTGWSKDGAAWKPNAFETRKAGWKLEVTPQLKADGAIELQLKPLLTELDRFVDLDAPGKSFATAQPGKRLKPVFAEGTLDTTLRLKSDDTVALSGIPMLVEGKPATGNPESRRQLTIFVSVRLIKPAAPAAAAAAAETSAVQPASPDAAQQGQNEAAKIIIPQVELRDATVEGAVEFLRKKSRELAGSGKAIEILLGAPAKKRQTRLSITLKNVPLADASRYIASLADLPLAFAPGRITIGTPGEVAATPASSEKHLSPEDSPMGQKSLKIVFPKVEFREASIQEAVDFLRKMAVELDPEHAGVNIVLKLPAAPPADRTQINPIDARITLSLTNIPLYEALKYVAGLSELELVVQPDALLLQPAPPHAPSLPALTPVLPLDPPPAQGGAAMAPSGADPILTVDQAGVVKWNGEVLANDVLQKLRELKAAKPDVSLVLRPAPDTPYKTVMDVLGKLERAGIQNVGLVNPASASTGTVNTTSAAVTLTTPPPPPSKPGPLLITKEWKVEPQWVPLKPSGNGQEYVSARDWLVSRGIVFEGGAVAAFFPATSRLVVRNTQAQLDLIDQVIAVVLENSGTLRGTTGTTRVEKVPDSKGATTITPAPGAAKPSDKPIGIEAESTRMENGIAIAKGDARMTWGEYTVTADTIRYDSVTRTAHVTGKVEVANDINVIQAEDIEVSLLENGHIAIKGPHKTIIRNPPPANAKRVDDPAVEGFTSLLQGEQFAVDGKAAEAQEKLREGKQSLNRVQASDAALRQRLAQLEQRLAQIKGGTLPASGGAAKPAPQGRVLAVNLAKNFAVLSMGERAGVAKGATFNIFRGDEAIARVRISSLEPSTAIADILPESVHKDRVVQPGDSALPEGLEVAPPAAGLHAPQLAALPPENPPARAASSDPADAFVAAYLHVQKSEVLQAKGDKPGALRELETAARQLDEISKSHPEWQPEIVTYRKQRTAAAIKSLRQTVAP